MYDEQSTKNLSNDSSVWRMRLWKGQEPGTCGYLSGSSQWCFTMGTLREREWLSSLTRGRVGDLSWLSRTPHDRRSVILQKETGYNCQKQQLSTMLQSQDALFFHWPPSSAQTAVLHMAEPDLPRGYMPMY